MNTEDNTKAKEVADAEWQKQFNTLGAHEPFGRRHVTEAGVNCYLAGLSERGEEMISREKRHADDKDILESQLIALQNEKVALEGELEQKDELLRRLQDPQNPKFHQ